MAGTLLMNGLVSDLEGEGEPWLPVDSLEQTTGWALKPEGACQGDRCVPIPAGREAEFVVSGRFNVASLARYLGQPVVHDVPTGTWVIGESADVRASNLRSLQAPDFTLPDHQGVNRSLSDYRGRKVFLVSWASW